MRYRKVWDLDTLFPGGSESHQLSKHIEYLVGMVSEFKSKADCFHTPQDVGDSIKVAELIEYISTITTQLSEANSFTTCLLAQNPKDQKASTLQGQIESVRASFDSVVQKTQSTLVNTERNLWKALLDTDVLCNYEFKLNEWRKKGQLQLTDNEEKLVTDLMVDGYHAWRSLYNALMGNIIVRVPINGKISELSMGQAMNLRSHPDVEVRKESHKALEDVWMQKEELVAKVLNHIAGFRFASK